MKHGAGEVKRGYDLVTRYLGLSIRPRTLDVFVVKFALQKSHHRGTENTEDAQRA
jgi:hypothetical protein